MADGIVLAFDPATKTGWAFHDGEKWHCGSIDLVYPYFVGVIDSARVLGYDIKVVCENPGFNRGDGRKIHFAMAYIELAYGYISNTPVEYIPLATWRAYHGIKKKRRALFVTGRQMCGEDYPLKQQAIDIALGLGASVPKDAKGKYDDNAAESCCIAAHVMNREGAQT